MTREEQFDACPFCGCEEIVCGAFSISPDCYVTCAKCGAMIETDVSWKGMDSQEEHDKACKEALLPLWNKRASRPIPDPITGLVNCGCGGVPQIVHKNWGPDNPPSEFSDVMCQKCGIIIEDFDTPEQAKDGWNTARGYRA